MKFASILFGCLGLATVAACGASSVGEGQDALRREGKPAPHAEKDEKPATSTGLVEISDAATGCVPDGKPLDVANGQKPNPALCCAGESFERFVGEPLKGQHVCGCAADGVVVAVVDRNGDRGAALADGATKCCSKTHEATLVGFGPVILTPGDKEFSNYKVVCGPDSEATSGNH